MDRTLRESGDSVLVVESSATLRHALRQRLTADGFKVQLSSSYRHALAQLRQPAHKSYVAVVVGAPAHASSNAHALLAALLENELASLAVVLLAHTSAPETFEWVGRRQRAAMLLWQDYNECGACLTRLLSPAAPTPAPSVTNSDIRILFVDDSRTVRATFSRLLARNGYAVETAATADAAFELARKIPFDIAIVDYFMPGGNGDTLCRRLRDDARTAGITTAIITGTYHEDAIRDSLEAGATECMFKHEADELFLTRIAAMSRAIRAKKSVEAERQRLEGILSSVGDGVYGVDRAGVIAFMNPAARRILGFAADDVVIGQAAHKLLHYAAEDGRATAPEVCVLQHAYSSANELVGWETVFWHRNGGPVPVECTVFPLRIENRLEGSVVAFRDISERRQLERELLWQANHDSLTKLYNRNYFERTLEAEISRLKRSEERAALLYIDLDRFKYINDTAGHAAGDQLLCAIANQLRARLRDSDLLARLGGDEFAIILRNVTEDGVQEAADGFRGVLEQLSFVYADRSYKVNGSIGIAMIDRATASPGAALSHADIACHIAKNQGRNQTHLYRPESDEEVAVHVELGWSVRLQEALKHDMFRLHFQPIVPVATASLPAPLERSHASGIALASHYEVLVRFADKRGDLIGPNAFLPTAERFGFMPQIDVWVLTHALQKLAELNAGGINPVFTINISGQTLDADNLVPVLKRLLAEYGVSPNMLIFEITESSAIANIEGAKQLIEELRALGCRFALDDFGTGFSSFNHLKHLPVDFIKIDGQFVQGMANDPNDRAIVASINDIAHSLGKRTVAEFVESSAILRLLKEYGVDYAQGHYIASPHAELIGGRELLRRGKGAAH